MFKKERRENKVDSSVLADLQDTMPTSELFIYVLPEGCRIERDVWYWDSSIWGADGTMEKYRDKWNKKIAGSDNYFPRKQFLLYRRCLQ